MVKASAMTSSVSQDSTPPSSVLLNAATWAVLPPIDFCKAIERVDRKHLPRIFAANSIAVVQLVYLNVPPVPETNSCIGIFWGPQSCASKMSWNRAGSIEPGLIAHSNGDMRTRFHISAFQTAFMFPLPNALSGLLFAIDVTTAM